jgi:hypothetical protein
MLSMSRHWARGGRGAYVCKLSANASANANANGRANANANGSANGSANGRVAALCRRTVSAMPIPMPTMAVPTAPALLPVSERRYISLTGPDARKLLQGLMTNDVNTLEEGMCLPTAFLSAKVLRYKYIPI